MDSDQSNNPWQSSSDPWQTPRLWSQTTEELLQYILQVRKTWKTSRGGETIWPLELEAALLEGLVRYQPGKSRETCILGRFPRRNRFISDYIFESTGKQRSPKQVGSRLQQLRETCGGAQLQRLLCPIPKPVYPAAGGVSSAIYSSAEGFSPCARYTVRYIDIFPPEGSRYEIESSSYSDDGNAIHPGRLEAINTTIFFTAPSLVVANSHFTVYCGQSILHTETAPLQYVSDQVHRPSNVLYSTQLIPKYWDVMVDSQDPTRFTIFQEVFNTEDSSLLFSAMYKFRYIKSPDIVTSQPGSSHGAGLMKGADDAPWKTRPLEAPQQRYSYSKTEPWAPVNYVP
ncbi:hypothetical protein K438DRAFT_1817494 [Mycena galopus ATCC 62051]|nr:hypothetical protein K438DRAFT_1817494 [Mycena galopus ATCC 62051]